MDLPHGTLVCLGTTMLLHLKYTPTVHPETGMMFTLCILVSRSLVFMGVLTIVGTGFGAYIMAMAALSPCPLLVHTASGTAIIVRLHFIRKCIFFTIIPIECLQTMSYITTYNLAILGTFSKTFTLSK